VQNNFKHENQLNKVKGREGFPQLLKMESIYFVGAGEALEIKIIQ